MADHKIYIALSTFSKEGPEPLDTLKKSGFSFAVNDTGRRLGKEELIRSAKGAIGIVAGVEPYDVQVLEALPALRCISRCGVGLDNVDLAAAQKKGIKVFNTPEVVVQPVVELTVGMILDLLRRITEYTILMRQHRWERLPAEQLAGKTVGVIGLGRIGRRVAETLVALKAQVIGYDTQPDASWAKTHGITLVDLKQILSSSDILTLHLAASAGNPFCLTAKDFKSMKKGAFIVNVSRGCFLDEEALVRSLKDGHLAGAALDVYREEPYKGPLAGLPNVILTPHVGTLTLQARMEMEAQAVANAVGFLKTL